MTPKFIINIIEKWIVGERYGELRITFQKGRIQRWTSSISELPPKSSGSLENPGVKNVPQDAKLAENNNE